MKLAAFLLLFCAVPLLAAPATTRPKVRCITAFLHLDRDRYQAQVQDTLQFLHIARAAVEKGGYEVEGVRITTQPFPEYTRGLSKDEALKFLKELSDLSVKEKFDLNIGPAMMNDTDDTAPVELLGEVLSTTAVNTSVIVAGDDGIHWKAIAASARLVRYVTAHSPHSYGNFNFSVTAMLAPYAPFYPGSYHTDAGHQFAVGLESANVVDQVFASTGGNPKLATAQLRDALAEHDGAVERIVVEVAKQTGWTYMGLDPTPAPLKDVSIGAAIEKFIGGKFGSSGTMTASAVITEAVRGVPVKHVGYSGLMLPILEDSRLAERWAEGTYDVDSLLAYSAVCGTGLDTIPLPGDTSEQELSRMMGDVATLAFKWKKPLSARLQPVAGKKAGDRTEFNDPYIVNTLIRKAP